MKIDIEGTFKKACSFFTSEDQRPVTIRSENFTTDIIILRRCGDKKNTSRGFPFFRRISVNDPKLVETKCNGCAMYKQFHEIGNAVLKKPILKQVFSHLGGRRMR